MNVQSDVFLLGIDGGGSQCRARLCAMSGARLGEGVGGPANIRLGIEQSFGSVLQATTQCMSAAGLALYDLDRIVACLALAGASEPGHLMRPCDTLIPIARPFSSLMRRRPALVRMEDARAVLS